MTNAVAVPVARPAVDRAEPATPTTARTLDRDAPLGSADRPTWRGRSHLLALLLAVPLLAAMLASAPAGQLRAGAAVYAAGLCSMLVASTTYHRWVHTLRWRSMWRRADHAMIFMAIAGTSTPLCLALLPPAAATVTLAVLWSAAIVGAAIKLCRWRRADRVATAMYITNSWAGIVLVAAMVAEHLWWPSFLLVAGGIVYTLGAVGFTRRWPTLTPTVFSYHEVWHLCTLTGAATHFAAVWIVVV
jgi:hemolysin III